jgi:hypothetical protein
MDSTFIQTIEDALGRYRQATAQVADAQAREDYLRLVAITEKFVISLRAGDLATAKMNALGFSRQASDSYSPQPPEFKPLAQLIAEAKKRLI